MKLSDLLKAADLPVPSSFSDTEISGLTEDSRKVHKGDLFCAIPGMKTDGSQFIATAQEKGAAAIFTPDMFPGTPIRLVLAKLAAAFYPKQPETLIAVTGTNGKTSTCAFCVQLWENSGKKAAPLGTLSTYKNAAGLPLPSTTPDPVTLHEALQDLAEQDINNVVMEVTSHALSQYRAHGLRLKSAALTNITQDHLDFHKTMENYRDAKLTLFTEILPKNALAVLNADTPEYEYFKTKIPQKHISYGEKAKDIRLVSWTPDQRGQVIALEAFGKRFKVLFPIPAHFQVMNALTAVGLLSAVEGFSPEMIDALEGLKGPHGRIELISTLKNGATVYTDYAHTPDGLENILSSLRPYARGRLAVVFGCGGDRDNAKRPIMGEIAARLADKVYVTDDNPRTEEPSSIRAMIMKSCPGAEEIDDRQRAIETALLALGPNDILVVAGKGHESGQILKDRTIPFDDAEEIRKAVKTHSL